MGKSSSLYPIQNSKLIPFVILLLSFVTNICVVYAQGQDNRHADFIQRMKTYDHKLATQCEDLQGYDQVLDILMQKYNEGLAKQVERERIITTLSMMSYNFIVAKTVIHGCLQHDLQPRVLQEGMITFNDFIVNGVSIEQVRSVFTKQFCHSENDIQSFHTLLHFYLHLKNKLLAPQKEVWELSKQIAIQKWSDASMSRFISVCNEIAQRRGSIKQAIVFSVQMLESKMSSRKVINSMKNQFLEN